MRVGVLLALCLFGAQGACTKDTAPPPSLTSIDPPLGDTAGGVLLRAFESGLSGYTYLERD